MHCVMFPLILVVAGTEMLSTPWIERSLLCRTRVSGPGARSSPQDGFCSSVILKHHPQHPQGERKSDKNVAVLMGFKGRHQGLDRLLSWFSFCTFCLYSDCFSGSQVHVKLQHFCLLMVVSSLKRLKHHFLESLSSLSSSDQSHHT